MEKIEISPNSIGDYMLSSHAYNDLYNKAFRRKIFSLPKMVSRSVRSSVIKSLGIHYLSDRDELNGVYSVCEIFD